MDYEKAYKAMVQRVKELHKDGNALTKQQMEIVCPELAESEDEKIRKWLVDYFSSIKETVWIHRDISCKQILTYLEKQKINTEGDFSRGYDCGYECCLNSHGAEWFEKQKNEAQRQYNLGVQAGREEAMYELEKEQYPLCETIKDKIKCYITNHFTADREVITDIPSIVHAMEEGVRLGKEEQNTSSLVQIVENNKAIVEDIRNGVPTKTIEETRGVKFATPIGKEEKPNNQWSEEDEDNLKRAINICINDFGENSRIAKFLKSLPERFNLQPKQKWSVEDEEKLNWCINLVISQDSLSSEWKKEVLDWLKSIRFQHQGSTHRDVLHSIYSLLKDYDFTQITPEHRVSLLNEIRVRCKHADEWAEILDEPCWKPSEEQMTDLFIAAREGCEAGSPTSNTLKTLYKDLEKL